MTVQRNITVLPATPERWSDLETVFNSRGCSVARGCWCMYYRRSGRQPPLPAGNTQSEFNRDGLRSLVDSDTPPGLIGYRDQCPVGWVSLGPREDYAKLKRSPVMKPVDSKSVWSIICFVVPAEFRRQGVASALLAGAIEYTKLRNVSILEAYPVDRLDRARDDSMFFGAKSMYDAAGFEEVARRKPMRPVVRLHLS